MAWQWAKCWSLFSFPFPVIGLIWILLLYYTNSTSSVCLMFPRQHHRQSASKLHSKYTFCLHMGQRGLFNAPCVGENRGWSQHIYPYVHADLVWCGINERLSVVFSPWNSTVELTDACLYRIRGFKYII